MYYNYLVPSVYTPLSDKNYHYDEKSPVEFWIKAKLEAKRASDPVGLDECYTSMFDMWCDSEPDTFEGFKGKHRPAFGYVVIDFDASGNTEKALKDAEKVQLGLGVDRDMTFLFYSGSKGFHLYIDERVFGEHIVHDEYCAKRVGWIVTQLAAMFDAKTIDKNIYQPNRKFRVPFSKHPKTGNKKELVVSIDPFYLDINSHEACVYQWKKFISRKSTNETNSETKFETSLELRPYATPALGVSAWQVTPESMQGSQLNKYGMDLSDLIPKYFPEKKCITKFQSEALPEGDRHRAMLALIYDWVQRSKQVDEMEAGVIDFCKRNAIPERIPAYLKAIEKALTGQHYEFGCYSGIKYNHCDPTCPIYDRLDETLRARQ